MYINILLPYQISHPNGSLIINNKAKSEVNFAWSPCCYFAFRKQITLTKLVYFSKICYYTTMFSRPPCCYYWLSRIKKYSTGMASHSIIFILLSNFWHGCICRPIMLLFHVTFFCVGRDIYIFYFHEVSCPSCCLTTYDISEHIERISIKLCFEFLH